MIAQGMMASKAKNAVPDQGTLALYLGALVCQTFHDLGLSTFITLALAIQCFAFSCLRLKISQTKSVTGISGRTLMLQALSCALRLSSTTWLNGYVPVDGTGDWLYQLLDVCALLLVIQLLYCMFRTHRCTYQEEQDNFNIE